MIVFSLEKVTFTAEFRPWGTAPHGLLKTAQK